MNETELKSNEKIYDQEINHLMAEIIRLCSLHGIPMFATFQLAPATEDNNELLCTTALGIKNCEVIQNLVDMVYKPTTFTAFTASRFQTHEND